MSIPDGGWSSHLEALVWAAVRTTGTVVEYGAGWYSTPVLHGLCEAMDRELWTVETEPQWIEDLAYWKTSWHHIGLSSAEVEAGLVFVDGPPADRAHLIRSAHAAQMVVVHDTEPEPTEDYGDMHAELERYRYARTWKGFEWWTTAVSDMVPLSTPSRVS